MLLILGSINIMAATAASTTAQSSAPIVHAIGGSIGSALALLLFYPIERARIEIQSQASAITPSSPSSSSQTIMIMIFIPWLVNKIMISNLYMLSL